LSEKFDTFYRLKFASPTVTDDKLDLEQVKARVARVDKIRRGILEEKYSDAAQAAQQKALDNILQPLGSKDNFRAEIKKATSEFVKIPPAFDSKAIQYFDETNKFIEEISGKIKENPQAEKFALRASRWLERDCLHETMLDAQIALELNDDCVMAHYYQAWNWRCLNEWYFLNQKKHNEQYIQKAMEHIKKFLKKISSFEEADDLYKELKPLADEKNSASSSAAAAVAYSVERELGELASEKEILEKLTAAGFVELEDALEVCNERVNALKQLKPAHVASARGYTTAVSMRRDSGPVIIEEVSSASETTATTSKSSITFSEDSKSGSATATPSTALVVATNDGVSLGRDQKTITALSHMNFEHQYDSVNTELNRINQQYAVVEEQGSQALEKLKMELVKATNNADKLIVQHNAAGEDVITRKKKIWLLYFIATCQMRFDFPAADIIKRFEEAENLIRGEDSADRSKGFSEAVKEIAQLKHQLQQSALNLKPSQILLQQCMKRSSFCIF
jgi:predicted transcriptional regulator